MVYEEVEKLEKATGKRLLFICIRTRMVQISMHDGCQKTLLHVFSHPDNGFDPIHAIMGYVMQQFQSGGLHDTWETWPSLSASLAKLTTTRLLLT